MDPEEEQPRKTLASRMIKRRGELGMSQGALARALGASVGRINKVERGESKLPRNIGEIAKALQVEPYFLLYGVLGEPPLDTDSMTERRRKLKSALDQVEAHQQKLLDDFLEKKESQFDYE